VRQCLEEKVVGRCLCPRIGGVEAEGNWSIEDVGKSHKSRRWTREVKKQQGSDGLVIWSVEHIITR